MEFGEKNDGKNHKNAAKFISNKQLDSLELMRQKMRGHVAIDARTALKNIEKLGEVVDQTVLAIQMLALKRRAFTLIRMINDASETELADIAKKLSK